MLQSLLNIGINNTNKLATVKERRTQESSVSRYSGRKLLRECHATKHNEKKLELYQISDRVFLPNDYAVMVGPSSCVMTDKNYNVVAKCEFALTPHSITLSRNARLAVSIPQAKKIVFLCVGAELRQITVVEERSTKYEPKALCGLKNGDIAVSWSNPVAFGIISVKDILIAEVYFCEDKSGRQLKSFNFMAVDEVRGHVIQPCHVDSAVYCFDLEGNPKFRYKRENFCPRAVALDNDKNIYACNAYKETIHLISPVGENLQIISYSGYPCVVSFRADDMEFAVNSGCTVTEFKLQ